MPTWVAIAMLCVGCVASQAGTVSLSPLDSGLTGTLAERAYVPPVLPPAVKLRYERACLSARDDAAALPAPPPGYGYMSVPVDSACSIHLIKDNRWFKWLRGANISITTANNMTELAKEQGAAVLHSYTADGSHAPLLFVRKISREVTVRHR